MGVGGRMIPVVMCGGAGTRLWPVSRNSMPKQFISLFGGESTFQRTMRLLSDPGAFGRPIVVTSDEYRFTTRDQLAAIGVEADIVLEPARRDSAPAVATAVELGLARDPRAVVGVFAADHVVQDGLCLQPRHLASDHVLGEGAHGSPVELVGVLVGQHPEGGGAGRRDRSTVAVAEPGSRFN